MTHFFCLLSILFFYQSEAVAVNIQQYNRSHSLTFETIEDSRLETNYVKNRYKYIFNLGLSYVDEPLVVKNEDNAKQLSTIVEGITTLHFGAGMYITPKLQVSLSSGFSYFKNNFDDESYSFQDITGKLKYQLYHKNSDTFSIMPTVIIPLNGGKTQITDDDGNKYGKTPILSDSGVGLGLFLVYERFFKYFQLAFNLGYTYNNKAVYKDFSGDEQINRKQVLTTAAGIYVPINKKFGINLEYTRNFTAPFFNKNLNPSELFTGFSTGLTDHSALFLGVGLGNLFSDIDGNDFRVAGGVKYVPHHKVIPKHIEQTKAEQPINDSIVYEAENITPVNKNICDNAYVFGNTNVFTVLFKFNSSIISNSQKNKINQLVQLMNNRANEITSINIIGHTSDSGTDDYNMSLGSRRAQAIFKLLKASDLDDNLFSQVESKGESDLLQPMNDFSLAKQNRRVEVLIKLLPKYQPCY